MSEEESEGRILSGLSLLGLLASVAAVITSAYIASRLGVAGTMIGVAVGTTVSTIAATAYGNALERGRKVARAAPLIADGRSQADDTRIETDASTLDAEDVEGEGAASAERPRRFGRKQALLWGGLVLAISLALIFTYEAATGNGFGGQENPGIGRIVHSGSSGDTSDPAPRPTSEERPTEEPTDDPQPEPEPEPEPTQPLPEDPPAEPAEPEE